MPTHACLISFDIFDSELCCLPIAAVLCLIASYIVVASLIDHRESSTLLLFHLFKCNIPQLSSIVTCFKAPNVPRLPSRKNTILCRRRSIEKEQSTPLRNTSLVTSTLFVPARQHTSTHISTQQITSTMADTPKTYDDYAQLN